MCVQDADASYDVNGRDNDPQPRYDPSNENRLVDISYHGMSVCLSILLLITRHG